MQVRDTESSEPTPFRKLLGTVLTPPVNGKQTRELKQRTLLNVRLKRTTQ